MPVRRPPRWAAHFVAAASMEVRSRVDTTRPHRTGNAIEGNIALRAKHGLADEDTSVAWLYREYRDLIANDI